MLPTFVRLAESDIRAEVRVRAMETTATLTISSGSADLPGGFIQAQRLILDNSTVWALDYLPPSLFYSSDNFRASGSTKAYTIEGDKIIFRPIVDQDALLAYYKAFDALSDDADTNWLLTNAYNVYLYGVLKYVADYLKDDAQLAKWAAQYQAAVAKTNRANESSRYAGGPLKVLGTVGP